MKEYLESHVRAARDLYEHVYDRKDWHVEDKSIYDYLKDLCRNGVIPDYLHLFS